jgi:hypothetical protein
MVVFKKIFLFMIVLCSSQAFAQSITALASVDSSNYLVGDYINYTLEIRIDKDVDVFNPVIQDSLYQVEIVKESAPIKKEADEIKLILYHFIISRYDSAEVTIPPIPILYKTKNDTTIQVVFSNPVSFSVHTVEVIAEADIKDVKSPFTIPLDWKLILLWFLIVAILIAVLVYFYKKYQKRKSERLVRKEIIKIPAHLKALAELDNLEKEQLWQKGLIKDYHSNITGIIRGYFENRFELPALELTTTESMNQLKTVKEAKIIYGTTDDFLNNADMVKFAKFVPLDSVNEEMMKQAKDIVYKTIEKESEIDEKPVQEEVEENV